MTRLVPDVAAFTELGDRLNDPIRTYSAGMMLRLAFATSLMCPHDILLLDEVIGVGDAAFISKAISRLTSGMSRPLLNSAGRALPVDDAMRLSDRPQVSPWSYAWRDVRLARL
jgi:ABC-type nitrate/sulfonate/bicarbonate transport system ATPase subunit